MRLFGEKVGIAFQIRDDLFDFGTDDVGKPLGIDIKEKKMTLPLIYTLNQVDRSTRRNILNIVKRESHRPEKVAEVIQLVRGGGGIAYAEEAMYRYREEAFTLLANVASPSPARDALQALVTFVTDRKK
jgi:octaprenyl-diphosphate synthase